ncbi:MAG: class I SAM-dependent methyltransferase [Myxococcota bacterium]
MEPREEATLNAARAEAFGQRVLDDLNSSAVVLMMSIGHRTGLFDVMSRMTAATSAEIARAAGLSERYVREWLGAMVTGEVVEYEAASDRYFLPPEHAASLTREARPGNMAVTCQWIPLLGSVEDEIVEVFQRGGGVPYGSFERFHAVMAEESDQTVVAVLTDAILPLVPGLVEALDSGIDVLDVGCGSGRALNHLASTFPKSRFRGYDFSEEGVAIANQAAKEQGLDNISFHRQDAAALEDEERFDLITAFDAIHDQARPDRVLAGIARALRPEGVFLMQDIAGSSRVDQDVDHPAAPLLYTISCMHCMTVSLANDGMGLGAMWGAETAVRMLNEAGFREVDVRNLPHDVMNYYYTARK